MCGADVVDVVVVVAVVVVTIYIDDGGAFVNVVDNDGGIVGADVVSCVLPVWFMLFVMLVLVLVRMVTLVFMLVLIIWLGFAFRW